MNAFILIILASTGLTLLGPPATYGDGFLDRYSVRVDDAPIFETETPLEGEVVIPSPSGRSSVTLVRTDGAKIPYEKAEAHIFVDNAFGDPIYFRSIGFRNIELSWVGERYLFIDKGIGRIVRIEEIFDLIDERWIVQHTVTYTATSE